MNTKRKNISFSTCVMLTSFFATFSLACTTRTQLLSTPLVSMTEIGTAPGSKKPIAAEAVSSEYCFGDKALSTKTINIGLLDEVIFRAQQKSKARYITDVQIFRKEEFMGKTCIQLEGTALK